MGDPLVVRERQRFEHRSQQCNGLVRSGLTVPAAFGKHLPQRLPVQPLEHHERRGALRGIRHPDVQHLHDGRVFEPRDGLRFEHERVYEVLARLGCEFGRHPQHLHGDGYVQPDVRARIDHPEPAGGHDARDRELLGDGLPHQLERVSDLRRHVDVTPHAHTHMNPVPAQSDGIARPRAERPPHAPTRTYPTDPVATLRPAEQHSRRTLVRKDNTMADAPPDKAPSKPRGTRPTQSETATLADAEHVVATANANLAAFTAADANQSIKRVTSGTLDRMTQLIAAVRQARGGQPLNLTGLLANTTAEIQARASLLSLLADARQRVATGYRTDRALQKTFGVGAHWGETATPPLVDGATQIITATQDASVAAKAAAAGVDATKIAQITAARDALVAADRQQNLARSKRGSGTAKKDASLSELKSDVAYVREVAKGVFASDPATLATFRSVKTRHTPKPRAAPAAGAPPKKKPRGTSKAAKRIKLAVAAANPGTVTPVVKKGRPSPKRAVAKKGVKKGTPRRTG